MLLYEELSFLIQIRHGLDVLMFKSAGIHSPSNRWFETAVNVNFANFAFIYSTNEVFFENKMRSI